MRVWKVLIFIEILNNNQWLCKESESTALKSSLIISSVRSTSLLCRFAERAPSLAMCYNENFEVVFKYLVLYRLHHV